MDAIGSTLSTIWPSWWMALLVFGAGLVTGFSRRTVARWSLFRISLMVAALGPVASLAFVFAVLAARHPASLQVPHADIWMMAGFTTLLLVYSLPAFLLVAVGGGIGRVLRRLRRGANGN